VFLATFFVTYCKLTNAHAYAHAHSCISEHLIFQEVVSKIGSKYADVFSLNISVIQRNGNDRCALGKPLSKGWFLHVGFDENYRQLIKSNFRATASIRVIIKKF